MLPRELLLRLTKQSHSAFRPPARLLSSSAVRLNVIKELEQRGLLEATTSRAVEAHVDSPRSVYLGVDPSAKSLHAGNLVALIGLLHFSLKGHNAIALIGGATGAVGDPSGRSTERNALTSTELNANIAAITAQLTAFLERGVPFAKSRTMSRYEAAQAKAALEAEGAATKKERGAGIQVENNLEWLSGMGLLQFLGSVGKGARISTMLSRESVKSRLDSSSGLSFTEFTYQLLQAFDFLTLHQRHACTIQLGGSDQLGNIMSGIEMIRKDKQHSLASLDESSTPKDGADEPAYGVTMPLLTTASGEKFGKSMGNAVWLDPTMTTPFEFYQFFLRTTDEEVLKYLKIFTFIRVGEMKGLMEEHNALPSNRLAQKILAAEVTELIHGPDGLKQALAATDLFFGDDLSKLDTASLVAALEGSSSNTTNGGEIPSMVVKVDSEGVIGQPLERFLIASTLVSTKTQARKAIEAGMITLNGKKVPAKAHQRTLTEADLLPGGLVVLRLGKLVHKAVLLQ